MLFFLRTVRLKTWGTVTKGDPIDPAHGKAQKKKKVYFGKHNITK